MKFGAVYCLYDDYEYLEISLESVSKKLDKILFLVSDVPWNGKISSNSATIRKIESLCKSNSNFELVQGHWTSEVDQRNFGLKKLFLEDIDYCFIIDSDEIYHDFQFENIKKFVLANPTIAAFHLEWNTYWKKKYYVIAPRESYTPVIVVKIDSFKFISVRQGVTSIQRSGDYVFETKQVKYNGLLIPQNVSICYHLSYARSDENIKRKLETSSHANEFKKDWFENVWLKWKPEDRNLHPVTPEQYSKAIPENFLTFPSPLKRFIKQEKYENNKCSIIILNWNSFDLLIRCLDLVKKNTQTVCEIIVIDNGSKNLPEDFNEIMSSYDITKIIRNEKNLGFIKGVNQGIKISEPDSDICLLNVDAEPQAGWLENLYETLIANPQAGIVGPLGNEIESGYQRENMVAKDSKVFNVHFYCVLIFREVINRIGVLDPRFGMGSYEDNDFCIRAMLAGYESWISSKSLVKHKGHQVFNLNNIDYVELESKNKEILENKLIQCLYEYGTAIDLFTVSKEIAELSGLKVSL